MKRKILIIIALLFILIFILIYIVHQFDQIEKENYPYLSNKEDVIELYTANKELFNSVAMWIGNIEDGIYFYTYGERYNIRESYPDISEQEFEQILYMLKDLEITDIYKSEKADFIAIYQNKPVVFNDINIGLTYHIDTGQWDYRYYHCYDKCHHKHKFCYRIYDFLLNRNGGVISK